MEPIFHLPTDQDISPNVLQVVRGSAPAEKTNNLPVVKLHMAFLLHRASADHRGFPGHSMYHRSFRITGISILHSPFHYLLVVGVANNGSRESPGACTNQSPCMCLWQLPAQQPLQVYHPKQLPFGYSAHPIHRLLLKSNRSNHCKKF